MKEIKDSCINEFDPNALSVEDALEKILKSTKDKYGLVEVYKKYEEFENKYSCLIKSEVDIGSEKDYFPIPRFLVVHPYLLLQGKLMLLLVDQY